MQQIRKALRGALVGCLLLLAASAGAARIGDTAPAFELPDFMQNAVSLADYGGMPAVLVFYRGFF